MKKDSNQMKTTHLPPGFQPLEADQPQWRSDRVPTVAAQVDSDEACELDDGYYELTAAIVKLNLNELFHKNPNVREKALRWFMSKDERPPGVSGGIAFLWACHVTNTEPSFLLRKLRESVFERAQVKARKGKTPLDVLMERIQPFLNSGNGKGVRP
jgi:hypothetical protein